MVQTQLNSANDSLLVNINWNTPGTGVGSSKKQARNTPETSAFVKKNLIKIKLSIFYIFFLF